MVSEILRDKILTLKKSISIGQISAMGTYANTNPEIEK